MPGFPAFPASKVLRASFKGPTRRQNTRNDEAFLGHELDAFLSFAPYDALTVSGGYGALITGEGARAILGGRAGAPSPFRGYVQVKLTAP